MEILELIGRVMFVVMFVMSGMAHVRQRESYVAYARGMGSPRPDVLVPVTGLMILVGGVLIGLGLWADLGALLIAAFLVPAAYYMHAYWKVDEPQMRMNQQAHFMKNMSLAGAALVIFYLFNQFGPQIGLTIGDGRLFPEL